MIDSLGFVELVEEVQARYGIAVEDVEITEENFGSIDAPRRVRRAQARPRRLTLTAHARRRPARARRAAPDARALVAGERRLTYAELDARPTRSPPACASSASTRGDRVAVVLPNGVEAAIAIYGALRAGAAFTPLNPTIKAEKLAYVLADCAAPPRSICDARAARARSSAARAARRAGELRSVELRRRRAAALAEPSAAPRDASAAPISTSTSRRSSTRRARPGGPRA